MKATLCLWGISAVALFGFFRAPAAAADTNGFRLTIELQDGSKLTGRAGDEIYQFHSEVLGGLKLPLARIRTIAWPAKTNSVKLTTADGDTISAQFVMTEIRIETTFGKIKLPANLLRQIQVTPAGVAAKNRPGLIALWSGEGDGKDSVGGNDAISTDVSFVDGQIGQAFLLNGHSSYLRVPHNSTLNTEGDGLTFTVWMKPAENVGYHPIIQWSAADSSGYGVNLRIGHSPADRGVLYADFLDANSQLHELSSPSGMVASGRFQFVALTYDKARGQALLYLNGMVAAQTQLTTPMSLGLITGDLLIGRRMGDAPGSWGYNCFFSGILDEIAVYNRALSAEEIRNTIIEENHGEPLPPPAA